MNNAIKKLWFTNDRIWIKTTDGTVKNLMLEVFPELYYATNYEREDFYLYDNDRSIRWDNIDLDINISNFFEDITINSDNEVNKLLSQFPFLDLKAFASYVNMHWTKLARYKFGVWEPSEAEFEDINKGLQQIAKEMLEVV